ncbi:regulator of chromosome condensation, putative [Trypanosoma equiperdum]|uniref:Regulator of chromosome condensation, putative n=4 Tax=Trypanozoon TaxID=39700 RepID=Q57WT1_TRYB2|nr:regulator of chromosome condensation, putative [Trypanosoma brucei gambiense DAL972]XP_845743.1 regulator of chromosome condensation, putative [Trypanosoma brucei brucei TREU927]AAX69968.1 regulator of chromosome condensation, putative [Trypanosoma brucei]RHW71600.1 regulator of chromosome condensation [Trypanosoma brucei equiperdum]SCU67233.1 regulator of chromosome condensation, putative [Trypanosoma equiperdum]AAZ12184.1 regulator of chromosome condensation, putative [Trypanosoma brucei |eukprot:XP_011774425.1 regulator of chromosome condensation, putative [Trypanosoma brucei gambiense DAL972]
MRPLVERFLRGDNSVLSQILMRVESQGDPTFGDSSERLYNRLIEMLVHEGRRASGSARGSPSNKENCFVAIRVFNIIFERAGVDAPVLRRCLTESGSNNARMMNLDHYFSQQGHMNMHVARFALTLTKIYRISVETLLTAAPNIVHVERLAGSRENSNAQSSASSHDDNVSPMRGTFSAARSNLRGEGRSVSNPRAGRGADGARVELFQAVGNSNRHWRELPDAPSFVPFSVNPLYSENVGASNHTWMPPQFPTPVLLFSRHFGAGCEAKLPIMGAITAQQTGEQLDAEDAIASPTPERVGDGGEAVEEVVAGEKPPDLLLSRYLAKGAVLTWGNIASVKTGKKLQLASPSDGESPPQGSYTLSPTRLAIPVPVVSFSCGAYSCYFVTMERKILSCGNDDWGQLGAGKSKDSQPPGAVKGSEGKYRLYRVPLRSGDQICKLAAGSAFAVAIGLRSRRMYLWGQNSFGQCLVHEGMTVRTPVLVDIPGQYTEVVDVACGGFYAALSFTCGSVGTWGLSTMLATNVSPDQLRDADAPNNQKCAKTINLFKPLNEKVVALRAGPCHCLAITSSGAVYSWGVERNGRLGHGSGKNEEKMRLIDALSNQVVTDASCGSFHTAVLTKQGQIFVFGENTYGQLGLPTRQPRLLPEILPLPKRAISVSCGREHTCILLEDGDVMACGSLRCSGVGVGFGSRFVAPRRAVQNYLILTLASGDLHVLAAGLLRTMALTVVQTPPESPILDDLPKVNEVARRHGLRGVSAGNGFTIILAETGEAFSIGQGENGQLGMGDTSLSQKTALRKVVVPDFEELCAVECGFNFAIAIGSSGALYSWGWNTHGQLGHGVAVNLGEAVFTPKEISALKSLAQVVQVACGGTFVIALTQCGEVYSWGETLYCGHGTGGERCLTNPKRIAALQDIAAVAAGDRHAAAVSYDHVIYAWGRGPVGDGGSPSTVVPVPVAVKFAHPVRQLVCCQVNTFIITDVGDLYVWGLNNNGQCGALQSMINSDHSTSTLRQKGDEDGGMKSDQQPLLFPTFVASGVREAAFTKMCGVYVKEDGSSYVCGRVRQNGRDVTLKSFTQQWVGRPPSERDGETGAASPSSYFVRCFHGYDSIFQLVERKRQTPASLKTTRQNLSAFVRGSKEKAFYQRNNQNREK